LLLTDTFIRILLCFFLRYPVDSVLFLWNFLRGFLWTRAINCVYIIYFRRHSIISFFVKRFFLLKAYFFHYRRIAGCIFLIFITLIVIFIYLFLRFLGRLFTNKDFFILAIFDFVETFFVEKNVCNTIDYLRRVFPVLSSFIFIILGKFKFFRCFKFFYFHIRTEELRQKILSSTIKVRAEKIDKIRYMLSGCYRSGWSYYYATFSKIRSEIDAFDLLFGYYSWANNLENKASSYLLLRGIRLDIPYFIELIRLKETMDLIFLVTIKKKYVYDGDDGY